MSEVQNPNVTGVRSVMPPGIQPNYLQCLEPVADAALDAKEAKWRLEKAKRKRHQKDQELVLDELLPKATGREALIEKKKLRREQRRQREESPELMKERDVMGDGEGFHQRLAKEQARRERRQMAKIGAFIEKKSQYEAAEAGKLAQFRALLDLSGGKITIPKRNDPPPPPSPPVS
ncbi:hypothetical protein CBR_g3129 [Chara braunii]|uniref:Uncharacterized protein n=1 Tax=Chara braunii TaxID=69332 RepID=A0A388KEV2_CHABU|nr:hypothetical protein CBR_g3129 [Chara braunii]|eukprot:GBG68584.1 hypothetical protein CBR_g3129 [Chara braunii]